MVKLWSNKIFLSEQSATTRYLYGAPSGTRTLGPLTKSNGDDWFAFDNGLKWVTFDEEEFLNVDRVELIGISSSFVDVKISSMDRDDIKIKYSGKVESNVVPVLKIDKRLEKIEIEIKNEDKEIFPISKGDLVLQIFIPTTYDGNVNIGGVSSDIDIRNLVIENLNVSSISGDIDIENVSGSNFNISSKSGDLEIEESIGKMNLQSSSGNIELDNKENIEDIKITTSSGDITLKFGKNPNYSIKGTSSTGDFKSSFPMSVEEQANRNFKVTLGRGDKDIEINTLSGDVKFLKE